MCLHRIRRVSRAFFSPVDFSIVLTGLNSAHWDLELLERTDEAANAKDLKALIDDNKCWWKH